MTAENVGEFLQLYASHKLVGGIREQIDAFAAGSARS